MVGKRRVFSAAFKAKVALAAVRGQQTASQLAAQFSVHPNQVATWKKQLQEGANDLFADGRTRRAEAAPDSAELFEQIGRLKMELEWLKKKAAQLE
jgi:transposase-like protein